MSAPLGRSRLLRLADGRALAWTEWGDPAGEPVIDFHGNPGSRLRTWGEESDAARAGVRVIGFDRPGIGQSDLAPARSVAEAVGDALALADHLGFERFGALGYSLGGAYAAALAAAAPTRLTRLALVASVVPLGTLGGLSELGHADQWRAAWRAPRALALAYRLVGAVARRSPASAGRLAAIGLSAPDRAIVARPEVRKRLAVVAVEAARHGGRGTVEDMRAAMRPWGFGLGEITTPTTVWQGDADLAVPPSWGERLAATVPGAELRIVRGQGHCMIEDGQEEILRSLRE